MSNFRILLVEDNMDHADLIQRALLTSDEDVTINVARDGQIALEILSEHADKSGSALLPHLILLDIKLPKLDGFEVLTRVKSNSKLASIPVVILTTSTRTEEIKRAYELGANSYVSKPIRFKDFMISIQNLQNYWMKTNRFAEVCK